MKMERIESGEYEGIYKEKSDKFLEIKKLLLFLPVSLQYYHLF